MNCLLNFIWTLLLKGRVLNELLMSEISCLFFCPTVLPVLDYGDLLYMLAPARVSRLSALHNKL